MVLNSKSLCYSKIVSPDISYTAHHCKLKDRCIVCLHSILPIQITRQAHTHLALCEVSQQLYLWLCAIHQLLNHTDDPYESLPKIGYE